MKLMDTLKEMYREAIRSPVTFGMEYPQNVATLIQLIESIVKSGRPHALELALSLGQEEGPNALHYAAGCGCVEVCARLLTHCGRLIFQTDEKHKTPLMWAVKRGLVATTELLLRHGADSSHADARGCTILYLAASHGFEKVGALLLSTPGIQQSINYKGVGGRTALHAAAEVGSVDMCERLVGLSADIMALSAARQTPLILAAKAGHAAVAQYLMKVDDGDQAFLLADGYGKRALDYAREQELFDVVAVLKRPETDHRKLLRKWQDAFSLPDRLFLHPEIEGMPQIGQPMVVSIKETEVRLVVHIRDLQHRIEKYSLEVRDCRPSSRQPGKLFYNRRTDQRPIDDVDFDVPRIRSAGGAGRGAAASQARVDGGRHIVIWDMGGEYQFRILGHGHLDPRPESDLRTVISTWSPVVLLKPDKPSSRREHSLSGAVRERGRSSSAERCRYNV